MVRRKAERANPPQLLSTSVLNGIAVSVLDRALLRLRGAHLLRARYVRNDRLILWEKKSVTASGDNLTNYPSVPKYRYGEVEDKDQIVIVAPNDEERHNLTDRRALVAWAVPRIPRTRCSAARS